MEIREEARAVSPPNYSTTINRFERASLLRFPKNYRSCDPYTLLYTYDCFCSVTFRVSSRPRSRQSRSRSCRWLLKKATTSTKGVRIGRSNFHSLRFPAKRSIEQLAEQEYLRRCNQKLNLRHRTIRRFPLISVVRLFSEPVRIVCGKREVDRLSSW